MKSPRREFEIKLELTSEQMRRLRARSSSSRLDVVKVADLQTVYFDTPDWALRSEGLALRVRRRGNVWIQTLKADRAIVGGVSNPIEVETEVPSCTPSIEAVDDKKLRRKLTKIAREAQLVPIVETTIRRSILSSSTRDGDAIEVALDEGTVQAASTRIKFREAEIELKSGSPAAMLPIVRELLGNGPVRPSRLSKVDRGYLLLGGEPAASPAATKPEPPAIISDMTSGAALVEICNVTSAHVLRNWQAFEAGSDPEAAHQLRVGLRRLRAMLRILRLAYDDDDLTATGATARELGRVIGTLRDIDVLSTEIVKPLAGSEHVSHGIAIVQRRLDREGKSRRTAVLSALIAPPFGLAAVEFALLPHIAAHLISSNAHQFGDPVLPFATKALRRLLRRVTKRARDLSSLSIAERHELRKAIKPLRYCLEFFAPLYPSAKTRRLLDSVSALQDTLGYLNDVALAEQLLELDWSGTRRQEDATRAIGAVIGWHTAKAEQAWGGIASIWKSFDRAARFLG